MADTAVFDGKSIVLQSQSENSEAGIKVILKLIKELPNLKIGKSAAPNTPV